jgi:hypothetical protein
MKRLSRKVSSLFKTQNTKDKTKANNTHMANTSRYSNYYEYHEKQFSNINKATEHPQLTYSMSQYDITYYPQYPQTIPGAKGDGICDDTKAIQNAINTTPIGGELYLPPGTYSITTTLRINHRLKLKGPGIIQCDIRYAVPDWSNWMIVITADGCVIEGVHFLNKHGREGASVMLVEGNNFTLTNCLIEDFYQGIMLGRMVDPSLPLAFYSNIQITNNKILNVYGETGGSIRHGDAIAFFGCTDVNIANNVITAAHGRTPRNGINSGPEGYVKSTRVMIANNTVTGDWDYAITTEGGTHCQILHNYIEGCCINGIIERGENILVSENRIHIHPGRESGLPAGIQFYGVDNGTISKNVITGGCKYGILCKPSHETGGGNNTLIKENIIDGEFQFCIYLGNTNQTTVCNNTLKTKSSDSGCMGVHGWYNGSLVCERNELEVPSGTAFILSGTSCAEIKNNRVLSTRAGVYIAKETAQVCVCENDLEGCFGQKWDQHPECKDITQFDNLGV